MESLTGINHCFECGEFCPLKVMKGERTAHSEEPFKCLDCDKTFLQKYCLDYHAGVHRTEKSFQCPECSKIFERKGELTAHRRTHTGEKPFQCTECSKSFPRKTALNVHMRIHTGEKPYQCPKCGRAFSQSSSMKTHLKMHIRDEKYKCSQCQKSYKNEEALANHIKHHGLAKILLNYSSCEKDGEAKVAHEPSLNRGSESVPFAHCATMPDQPASTNSTVHVIDCSPEKVKEEPVDDLDSESDDPLKVEAQESRTEPEVKVENQDENFIYIKEERA